MGTKQVGKNIGDIESSITRLKQTYTNLDASHARQIRIMVGDFSPVVVCDTIYPTAEFKKEYLRRIKYRIIELQSILFELKGENVLSA